MPPKTFNNLSVDDAAIAALDEARSIVLNAGLASVPPEFRKYLAENTTSAFVALGSRMLIERMAKRKGKR